MTQERARLQFVDEVHSQSIDDHEHQLTGVCERCAYSLGVLADVETRHARPVENRCREINNVGYIEPWTQQGVRIERGEETGNVAGGCRCLFGHSFAKSAMSLRKKEPSNVVLPAAVYARSRASLWVAPDPLTVSTRPPSVTVSSLSSSLVPAWKTVTSLLCIFQPGHGEASLVCFGVSARRHDNAHAGLRTHPQFSVVHIARNRCQHEVEEVGLDSRQDNLRLGVAEAAVELDDFQAIAG